jgi:hypothetical protein
LEIAASSRTRVAGLLATGVLIALGLLATSAPAAAATLDLSVGDGVVGGPAIQASAALSDTSGATGTIAFQVFAAGDTTCTGAAASEVPATEPVTVEGSYVGAYSPPSASDYGWRAVFRDGSEAVVTESDCEVSSVAKATPTLVGTATSAQVGGSIHDSVVFGGGFNPSGGQLVFRAYGPADPSCAGAAAFEKTVAVNGDGTYVSPAFTNPQAGIYLWTVSYEGDPNNAASLSCNSSPDQASEVGVLNVTLAASASAGTVGGALTATATLANGGGPDGQLTFRAFLPGDASCAGAAAFTTTVAVKGNGSYRSASFVPTQVGVYRWTVTYSGDPNHAAAGVACGAATSTAAKAVPTIVGQVPKRLVVGNRFRDTVTFTGGYAPSGTVTFEIYGPGGSGCVKPAFVNTVKVIDNGIVRSDPFVAKKAGRYRFVARYSGDAKNQPVAEACGASAQLANVKKRIPKLRPLAELTGPRRISIRARLVGTSFPSGAINFRLYAPNDRRCARRPSFTGSLRVTANGTFTLAQYIATKPGIYRLAIAYSGDARNTKTKISCAGSQPIAVRR